MRVTDVHPKHLGRITTLARGAAEGSSMVLRTFLAQMSVRVLLPFTTSSARLSWWCFALRWARTSIRVPQPILPCWLPKQDPVWTRWLRMWYDDGCTPALQRGHSPGTFIHLESRHQHYPSQGSNSAGQSHPPTLILPATRVT